MKRQIPIDLWRRGSGGTTFSPAGAAAALAMALTAAAAMAVGFEPVLIAEHREATAVEVGPDGHLYVLSIARRSVEERSRFTRYRLDAEGEPTGAVDLLHEWEHRGDRENAGERPIGIAFDPKAAADNLIAWLTINRDPTSDRWGGRLTRAVIPPAGQEGPVRFEDRVVNLPIGFHEVNQLTFSPEGLLYICVGSTTTSGAPAGMLAGAGGPEYPETPLSAAIIEVDLSRIDGTLDVKTAEGGAYDPMAEEAPVRPYATGIRQVYDVVWHGGRLYGSVNQSDVRGRTGSCDGVPDLRDQNPPEFLAIFKRGHTYGFPNASRGECVLMGGRPSGESNAWYHIQDYPVGVEPHPGFDPGLLYPIGDRYAEREWDIGGGSANGIISYKAPGPHQGRLIQAFYGGSGAGRLWAFLPGPDGRIMQRYPLRDSTGAEIRLPNCLDIAQHPTGRLYVARYGNQGHPVDGDLWMLRPAATGGPAPAGRFGAPGFADGVDGANMGRTLYTATCAACHRLDGAGFEAFPPLDESKWVKANDPEALARIILHGKWDGPAMMPPHQWMGDDAIAAVVNFVRQHWGAAEAKPIDPAEVHRIRAEHEARQSPWKEPELEALLD